MDDAVGFVYKSNRKALMSVRPKMKNVVKKLVQQMNTYIESYLQEPSAMSTQNV